MPSAPGAPLLLTTRLYARLRLADASTRSISVSGSAFVHATDAVDTFALSCIILGCWPGLGMTVSAVGNFCITVTNETVTPTGGITCSALGGAVNRHLLRLRLTSARSSRRLSTRGSTVANVQISQGNSRDLPAYACRIYVTAFRASIGLWQSLLPHPAVPPLIRFLFVRPAFCLGLPSDSRSPATPLPPANTSPCRVCRGLSPPSHPLGHHSQAGCAYAQRAMPGAHKKATLKGGSL